MKKKILQSLADSIIRKIEKAETTNVINLYYEIGLSLDGLSQTLGVELE